MSNTILENKKGNKGLVVIFVILLLGVFFFLGYATPFLSNFLTDVKVGKANFRASYDEIYSGTMPNTSYTQSEIIPLNCNNVPTVLTLLLCNSGLSIITLVIPLFFQALKNSF